MEYFQVRYSDGFMKKKNGIFQVRYSDGNGHMFCVLYNFVKGQSDHLTQNSDWIHHTTFLTLNIIITIGVVYNLFRDHHE